jgi:hypothetical protein
MPFRGRILIMAALVVVGNGAVADNPHTLTLIADRDATLYEDSLGDNAAGSGEWIFAGNNGVFRARRALLHFDVAALVPPGSVILGATLTLHPSPLGPLLAPRRLPCGWQALAVQAGGTQPPIPLP